MVRCPSCAHAAPNQSTSCHECGAFLGSPRDLTTLAIVVGSLLGLIGLLVLTNIVLPNLGEQRAIEGVKRGEPAGLEKLKSGLEHHEIAITGAPALGFDAEKFGDIYLVSFNYLSLIEETPKRYAAWWVFDPAAGKTTTIQNAQDFIEGFLLKRGLASQFPKGLSAPSSKGRI